LRKRNIPYKIYGGTSFYQRKEIKDIIAYFRLVVNPTDSEALKRIINYPARGIGQTTLAKIEDTANSANVSLWQVITGAEKYNLPVNKGTLAKLSGFVELINKFITLKDKNDAYDLASIIVSEAGISKDLHNGNTVEERARYENFEELMNGIRDFVTENHNNNESVQLETFLENIALLTDQDTDKNNDKDRVTLMTIHSAKGLEFPHIYIVGMEEGLFPSGMSSHTQKELEEERRLFYVALTRAMHRVTLSYCKSRFKYGSLETSKPSRFINEIDKRFVNTKQMFGEKIQSEYNNTSENRVYSGTGSGFKKPARPSLKVAAGRKLVKIKNTGNSDFKSASAENIKPGMNVLHQQFGKGRVIQIEGEGTQKKAVIFFPKYGEKKLLLRFAKLQIV